MPWQEKGVDEPVPDAQHTPEIWPLTQSVPAQPVVPPHCPAQAMQRTASKHRRHVRRRLISTQITRACLHVPAGTLIEAR